MEKETPFELPTFKGYTVDKRLRQFRRVMQGVNPKIEFIDFDSKKGRKLLKEIEDYFLFLYE